VVLAALLALLPPAPVALAQLPGRLFTTPAERAALDAERSARPVRQAAQAAQAEREVTERQAHDLPPPPPPEPFTMNGVVVRSSGSNTAWVDGRPVLTGEETDKGVRVDTRTLDAGGAEVTVSGSGQSLRLKPGQTFVPDEGKVSERFERPEKPGAAEKPQKSGAGL
jgi:hypothetical protein